ncbi:MAG: glycosyltransferase [Elusimicrobia bacterium]|nr:glycosyltransferase [Elusimicrobiota bacterium]
MAPKVSVVMGNHNYGRFLRQALDSVLLQELGGGETEVLVVDDGSTDDSRAILASYAPRVKTLPQERQGQATAFNRGLAAARGDIVCLLDSDDVFLPGKLASVVEAFRDPGVACVQHLLNDADVLLAPLPRRFPAWPARYVLDDYAGGRTQFTATSGLAFRRETLRELLPIPRDLFFYLDDFLAARSLFFGEIANIPRVLGLHRVHGANWCAGGLDDPNKIERDFLDRALYASRRDRWLAERGVERAPEAVEAERLDLWRRRILLESLRARPLEAARVWAEGLRGLPKTRRARFRAVTTALAVLSPSLYLALYGLYSRP